MMMDIQALLRELREFQALCNEVSGRLSGESSSLVGTSNAPLLPLAPKRELLQRLSDRLLRLRAAREEWLLLPMAERVRYPEVTRLLRDLQDQLLKLVVLDRENEGHLLRRGLVPPAHLPSPHRQRPHFVTSLYQRNHPSRTDSPAE